MNPDTEPLTILFHDDPDLEAKRVRSLALYREALVRDPDGRVWREVSVGVPSEIPGSRRCQLCHGAGTMVRAHGLLTSGETVWAHVTCNCVLRRLARPGKARHR